MKTETQSGLANQYKTVLTAEYPGGSVDYSILGEYNPGHNPILLIPGFTEGRVALQNFGEVLSEEGQRLIIVPEQPKYNRKKDAKLSVLDHQAEAVLGVIYDMNLEKQPIDIVTHSFGALILARAAEMAKDRDWKCFDPDKSSSVVMAPAGSNDKENIISLGKRFVPFITAPAPKTQGSRPQKDILISGPKNFFKNPRKTAREVWTLSKARLQYEDLGRIGLKPTILTFANDMMYPEKVINKTVTANLDNIDGYATVIGSPLDVPAANLKEYKEKTSLKGRDAKRKWLYHYRNANHNDPLFVPERSGKAVLQILDLNEHQRAQEIELATGSND